jgi:MMP 1-O-methyltransferase
MMKRIYNYVYNFRYNKILKSISQYTNIQGWLSEKEAYGLYNIATKLSINAKIVEIGSWKGKSTYCLAKGLKSGVIYAIDPFNADGEVGSSEEYSRKKGTKPLLNEFIAKMKFLNVLDKISILKGYSNEYVDYIDKIDFLFIDGDHSIEGCNFDFEKYAPKLKKGGYLAFHDYYSDRNELGPTWVIKNKVAANKAYKFVNIYDSLWVAKKIRDES